MLLLQFNYFQIFRQQELYLQSKEPGTQVIPTQRH